MGNSKVLNDREHDYLISGCCSGKLVPDDTIVKCCACDTKFRYDDFEEIGCTVCGCVTCCDASVE